MILRTMGCESILTRRHGDVLTVVREVRHWLYFGTELSRSSFRDAALGAGFAIVSETKSEGDLFNSASFWLVPSRSKKPNRRHCSHLTPPLAKRLDGEYDGWEARVVTQ
jgi:hypothetical protein